MIIIIITFIISDEVMMMLMIIIITLTINSFLNTIVVITITTPITILNNNVAFQSSSTDKTSIYIFTLSRIFKKGHEPFVFSSRPCMSGYNLEVELHR